MSENWGFAAFETDRYKLVVDEDAVAPCQLFDLSEDPAEDHDLLPDPEAATGRGGDHGDPRPPVLPDGAGPSHPELLHGRVRRVRVGRGSARRRRREGGAVGGVEGRE